MVELSFTEDQAAAVLDAIETARAEAWSASALDTLESVEDELRDALSVFRNKMRRDGIGRFPLV